MEHERKTEADYGVGEVQLSKVGLGFSSQMVQKDLICIQHLLTNVGVDPNKNASVMLMKKITFPAKLPPLGCQSQTLGSGWNSEGNKQKLHLVRSLAGIARFWSN